jgi:gliding motility-associated-like protein
MYPIADSVNNFKSHKMKRPPLLLFRVIIFLIFTLIHVNGFSQKNPAIAAGWQDKNPFSQKVFIENKGQFDNVFPQKLLQNNNIKYVVRNEGLEIYFTNLGVIYRHFEKPVLTEEEKEKREHEQEGKKGSTKEKKFDAVSYSLNEQWIGANPKARIIGEDQVENYFTYPTTSQSVIKADGFKKIVYQNIYPHIDIEYTFPQNKEGIKYAFILHPGADPSVIKMNYDDGKKVQLDAAGNVLIKSSLGNFTDHTPVSYYAGGKGIVSSFVLDKESVSFHLENYDATKTAIIDPWTTVPTFPGTNKAYDVDWDYQGNIYIMGGDYPYQLIKLNSAGAIQWTYVNTGFSTAESDYGDFAIDRNSGTAYICEPYNSSPGARIRKVNTGGALVLTFPGNPSINEMWRITYNSCTHKGVVGCGNTTFSYQAATFDTMLTSITPANVLGTTQQYIDITMLTIDDTNAYMVTTQNGVTNTDNTLMKAPIATALAPTTFLVSSGYNLTEGACATYKSTSNSNGNNGIGKGTNFLYTYDGAVLKKWSPWSGALLGSVTVTGVPSSCGGLAVDACDNVFVGTLTGVKEYNSSLVLVTTVTTASEVYDVVIGIAGQIYACGNAFVSQLPLITSCTGAASFSLSSVSSPATCAGNDGTATVSVLGSPGPFSYSWFPGGQTTATATGLSPGTYVVSVSQSSGASCTNGGVSKDTVVVTASSGFTSQTFTTVRSCLDSTTATINVTGGTPSFTYSWSGGQTTQTVSGLMAGVYTVTVIDAAGCQTIDSVTVVNMGVLSATYTSQNILCSTLGSISLNVTGGASPYDYTWSSGDSTQNITNITTPATYSVTVTDANGCVASLTGIAITGAPVWNISSLTIGNTTCNGSNGSASVQLSNSSSYSMFYYWTDSFGTPIGIITDSTITGLPAGTYFVEVYDSTFCKDTILTINILPSTNFIPTVSGTNTICLGQNTTLTAAGGVSYTWNPGGIATAAATVSPVATTTYTVTGTNAAGCTGTATYVVTISSLPVSAGGSTTICEGQSATLTSGGGTTYTWSPGGASSSSVSVSPTSTTTYTVTGTTSGCNGTATVTVNVNSAPIISAGPDVIVMEGASTTLNASGGGTYTWSPPAGLSCTNCQSPIATPLQPTIYCVTVTNGAGCTTNDCVEVGIEYQIEIPNVFTPNGDGTNETFYIHGLKLGVAPIKIYNRWGRVVYESLGYNNDWNGDGVSDGVYYYILNYPLNGKSYAGFIQILATK